MYSRFRATGATPSVCLLCTFISRGGPHASAAARRHASQAVLSLQALRPKVASTSSANDVSFKSSGLRKGQPKVAVPVDAERRKQKAIQNTAKATRRALREAEETERRRKALATLDKTTKFVAAGLNISHEPTLPDLDRLKPAGLPLITLTFVYPEPSSRLHRGVPSYSLVERYSMAFQKLVNTLSTKFRRKQLFRLYKEGIQKQTGLPAGRPKPFGSLKSSQDVAGEIIRWLWHWPYVTEVEERKVFLTTRSERAFLMSSSEFFLLLGPDGSSLWALTEKYGLAVKSVKRSEDTFTLLVEGLSYMLHQLASVLAERKKHIISESVRLEPSNRLSNGSSPNTEGVSIRPDLLQRISKVANALVEDNRNCMFRISAHNARNIMMAKRLATRTLEQTQLPYPLLFAHLSTLKDSTPEMIFPHTYALYPYELSRAESMPLSWTSTGIVTRHSGLVSTETNDHVTSPAVTKPLSGPSYLYRARKVSDWLEQKPADSTGHIGGLQEGVGRLINTAGQHETLRKALGLLEMNSPNVHGSQEAKVTATTGHVVFSPDTRPGRTLLPPLRGSWAFSKLLDWMKLDTGRVSFIPEPPNFLANSSSLEQTTLIRLVYRSSTPITPPSGEQPIGIFPLTAAETLKFEVSLSQAARKEDTELTVDLELVRPSQDDGAILDFTLHPLYNEPSIPRGDPAEVQSSKADTVSIPHGFGSPDSPGSTSKDSPRFWKGVETFVNVMLPDRPMDMQLSSFYFTPTPREREPPELQDYASRCLRHSDVTSRPVPPLTIRYEGVQYVLDTNATVQLSSHAIADVPAAEVNVTIEHAVDSESKQHSRGCLVVCSEPNTTPTWQKFLGDCDRLTWARDRVLAPSGMYSELEDIRADSHNVLH